MQALTTPFLCLAILLALPIFAAASTPGRFISWLPNYDSALRMVTHENCESEYEIYKYNLVENATNYPNLTGWGHDAQTQVAKPIINCLLEETPELYKSAMASSQVLLGLMPTILNNIGPTIHETAILSVFGGRHILTFLIALASPAVFFDNTVGFRQSIREMLDSDDNISPDKILRPNLMIVFAEYVLAAAAVGNVAELWYSLVTKTAFAFAQDAPFSPGIWSFFGVVTHFLGAVIVGSSCKSPRKTRSSSQQSHYGVFFGISRWFQGQFSTEVYENQIDFTFKQCTRKELVISWFTGILSTVNQIWGTLMLSSVLFISPLDALSFVLRFMASTIVCRAIVRYEACILRDKRVISRELHAMDPDEPF